MIKKNDIEVRCGKCKHKWTPRVLNPRACPNCKKGGKYGEIIKLTK